MFEFFDQLQPHSRVNNGGVLGPHAPPGGIHQVVCLNRVFGWFLDAGIQKEAMEIEADARHVEIIVS